LAANLRPEPHSLLADVQDLTGQDGHKAHLEAVEDAFGADIDYAQLQKIYGALEMRRYSPEKAGRCQVGSSWVWLLSIRRPPDGGARQLLLAHRTRR
jgi:hypothetical protein